MDHPGELLILLLLLLLPLLLLVVVVVVVVAAAAAAAAVAVVVMVLVVLKFLCFSPFVGAVTFIFSVDVAAYLSTVPTANVVVVRTRPDKSRFLPAFFVFILFSVRFIQSTLTSLLLPMLVMTSSMTS